MLLHGWATGFVYCYLYCDDLFTLLPPLSHHCWAQLHNACAHDCFTLNPEASSHFPFKWYCCLFIEELVLVPGCSCLRTWPFLLLGLTRPLPSKWHPWPYTRHVLLSWFVTPLTWLSLLVLLCTPLALIGPEWEFCFPCRSLNQQASWGLSTMPPAFVTFQTAPDYPQAIVLSPNSTWLPPSHNVESRQHLIALRP